MLIGIDASRCITDRLTGTERYSREIITAMVRIAPQHRYRLYFRDDRAALREAYLATLPLDVGIEPIIIHSPRLWTQIGLRRETITRPPDALFVPAHVLPIDVTRRLHKVVTVHDVGYRLFPQTHPLSQRLYLDSGTHYSVRAANVVLADSHVTAQDLTRFYGAEASKIRVAYPGALPLADVTQAQIDAALSKFGIARGQPVALHIGTLQPRKNLRRLIAAWTRAHKPDGALLALAGGTGWRNEMGVVVNDSVKLLGYVRDDEKTALMHCARAYIFPSLYEGFGFPVLEAQSAGVPVACSNTSALSEVAADSAQAFDPLDIDDMAQAIEHVMCDESRRAQLIAAGRCNITRFSWDACARIAVGALEEAT